MMTKQLFLQGIERIQKSFPDSNVTKETLDIYYDVMKHDFTDHQFYQQVEKVIKNSFKFPPIAAFYKDPAEPTDGMTAEEKERIRKVLDRSEHKGE